MSRWAWLLVGCLLLPYDYVVARAQHAIGLICGFQHVTTLLPARCQQANGATTMLHKSEIDARLRTVEAAIPRLRENMKGGRFSTTVPSGFTLDL